MYESRKIFRSKRELAEIEQCREAKLICRVKTETRVTEGDALRAAKKSSANQAIEAHGRRVSQAASRCCGAKTEHSDVSSLAFPWIISYS
jgi:hypothetical protein